VRRREFITLLGGAAAAWPLAAHAQQHAKIARIGFLGLAPASNFRTRLDALRAGLREVGQIEGKNIEIEFRWADSMDQLPELAADLVGMNVDIIFAPASTFVEPARRADLVAREILNQGEEAYSGWSCGGALTDAGSYFFSRASRRTQCSFCLRSWRALSP
jgi:hypothetical protein